MKLISYSKPTVGSKWFHWIWLGFIALVIYSSKPTREAAIKELSVGIIFFGSWVIIWRLIQRLFPSAQVFDDGDALLVVRGVRQTRIPIESIRRVTWDPNLQRVKLELMGPSELGDVFRFSVQPSFTPKENNEIADDLHRRSRCCKGDED